MRFGEKLYLWLKYARAAFPRAAYYGKIDDDTYVTVDYVPPEVYICTFL